MMLDMVRQDYLKALNFRSSILVWATVAISMAILTTSCLVRITTPYYRPSAETGDNVRAIKRQPRTDSVILFRHDGVVVGINTLFESKHHGFSESTLSVDISFEIPEGKAVRLLDKNVQVLTPLKSWSSVLTGRIWTAPGRTENFPVEGKMIGKNNAVRFDTAQGYGNTRNGTFFFSAILIKGTELESFKLRLPRFVINDLEVNEPIITFRLNKENIWTSVP